MKRLFLLSFALIGAKSAFAQIITVPVVTITTDTTKVERVIEIDDSKYNRISLSYASYQYKCKCADDGIKRWWWNGEARQGDGLMVDYIHGRRILKTNPLFVESGLSFQANSQWNGWSVALAIPLNISYKISHRRGFYFSPYAGVCIGLDLLDESINSCKGKYSYAHYTGYVNGEYHDFWQETGYISSGILNTDLHEGILNHKYFQIGYNVGANVGFNQWNLKVGYRENLTPTVSTDNDGNITTGTFYVGLGYNF